MAGEKTHFQRSLDWTGYFEYVSVWVANEKHPTSPFDISWFTQHFRASVDGPIMSGIDVVDAKDDHSTCPASIAWWSQSERRESLFFELFLDFEEALSGIELGGPGSASTHGQVKDPLVKRNRLWHVTDHEIYLFDLAGHATSVRGHK